MRGGLQADVPLSLGKNPAPLTFRGKLLLISDANPVPFAFDGSNEWHGKPVES